MKESIPLVGLVVVVILMLLVLFALWGGDVKFNYAFIGIWTIGIVIVFFINSVRLNDFSFGISMFILAIIVFSMAKTGVPSLYDFIVAGSTCFIIYIFGRRAEWFIPFGQWNYYYYYTTAFFIIIFFALIFGIIFRESENSTKE